MERPKWTERTGGAPVGDDSLEMTELAGGVPEGMVDLGDDVNRSPENTEGVFSPPEVTQLNPGIEATATDLGEDSERLASEG